MNTLIAVIILGGATLLQVTLAPYIEISGVHPDLVLVLVVSWIVLRGLEEGLLWAFIAGVSLDMLSGAPFGVFTLTMLVVAWLVSLFHGRIFGSSIVLPLSLIFPLSLLFNGLALFLLAVLGRPIAWSDVFFSKLVPVAIFNTMMMMPVFPLLYLLNRLRTPKRLSF